MKRICTLLIITSTVFGIYAQDIIVKNDKSEIKAKIEELTETTIKYKKIEMLDGPSYNINKREVFMIIYKNGTKEYIETTNTQPNQTAVQHNTSLNSPSIQNGTTNSGQTTNISGGHEAMVKIRRGYYSFEGNKLKSHSDYITTFEKYGYNDLAGRAKEARTFQFAASGVGLTMMIVGLATNKTILVPLGGLVSLIFGLTGVSARENAVQQFNNRATKKVSYNSKLEISPILGINGAGGQVGVSIGF